MLTRAIGAGMVGAGAGKIVFTASLLSFQGGILVPGYAASKHGLAGITKALANEWAGAGVNVNAIAPGYIATDNTQALQDDPGAQPRHPRHDPGRPVGAGRGCGRRGGVPRLARRRTTSTARCWQSTEGGCPDERAC